jgi:hypoxanthine phosphoribosyltransferase
MNEKIIGYDVIEFLTKSLALRFKLNGKYFTHVIGIARGGMIPATMMSYIFDSKLHAYGVSSYEGKEQKALTIDQDIDFNSFDKDSRILVIDDICDTGNTIDHIKEVIGNRFEMVRYASLFARKDTQHKVDHYSVIVNKDTWLVFPWEN